MKARIEFHELRLRGRPAVEVFFYVEDIKEFIVWCMGDEFTEYKSGELNYSLERASKSRAKRPHFKYFVKRGFVKVYPEENMLTHIEGTLHYACQHSLDILPVKVWGKIYNSYEGIDEPQRIGTLVTKDGERYPVTDHDISLGFMLSSKESKKYKDNFAVWIKYRREIKPFVEDE